MPGDWWTGYNLNIPPAYRSSLVGRLLREQFRGILAMLWLAEMMGAVGTAYWINDLTGKDKKDE